MKKRLCLLLIAALLFALTACAQKPKTQTDISSLPLEEAYAIAVQAYQEHPETSRDIGDLQSETQQIIEMDGKYYQSYVKASVDHRYVFISQAEFPNENRATWDWYTVGTQKTYALDHLGAISDSQK